jgi:hypothetical protein
MFVIDLAKAQRSISPAPGGTRIPSGSEPPSGCRTSHFTGRIPGVCVQMVVGRSLRRRTIDNYPDVGTDDS